MKPSFIIFIIGILCLPLRAQDKPRKPFQAPPPSWQQTPEKNGHKFSMRQLQQQEEQYIFDHSTLTMGQCKLVFPLLHQFKQRRREIDQQEFQLLKQGEDNTISDSLSLIIIHQIDLLWNERTKLIQTYQQQMLQHISPSQLLQLFSADHRFERHMLRNIFRGKGKNGSKPHKPRNHKNEKI